MGRFTLTQTERLQQYYDKNKYPDNCDLKIKNRGRAGWWAYAKEPRWTGDEGEFLGMDFKTAKKELRLLID